MTDIIKAAALAVTAALCAVVVKKQARELGLVLALFLGYFVGVCDIFFTSTILLLSSSS